MGLGGARNSRSIALCAQAFCLYQQSIILLGDLANYFGATMKTIQIYDPPMCCSTGICGTDIDPDLVNFAAMLSQLGTHGIKVERFNLGQQPMAFVENPVVKAMLDKEGTAILPLIFWDGQVHLKGRYPTKDERPEWFRMALGKEEVVS